MLNPPAAKTESLIEVIRATASRPLERAIAMAREAYTDEAFFQVEVDRVFRSGWMCVAHVSELPGPGDYVALDLLDQPLVAMRGRDGQVRVLSRVCAHRAMDILPGGDGFPRTGTTQLLTCPYHAWTYELDGRLRGCPHMEHAEGFDRADWPLPNLRSEIWNGFVFVNLDGEAEPLHQQYADFDRRVAAWNIQDMIIAISMAWDCDFNWKVMIENWSESYHHLGAHRTSLNPLMPGEGTWAEPEHPHFVQCHLPYTEPSKAARSPAGAASPGFKLVAGLNDQQQSEWGLYLGHPCFMLLTTEDRVLWYRLLPISADKCRLQTITLVTRETTSDPDYAVMLEAETPLMRDFHLEDMVMNAGVQKGLGSPLAGGGPLSHLEEPIWLIQRQLAARLNATYPPKAMRPPYHGPLVREP